VVQRYLRITFLGHAADQTTGATEACGRRTNVGIAPVIRS
jgi:hypothetical protein